MGLSNRLTKGYIYIWIMIIILPPLIIDIDERLIYIKYLLYALNLILLYVYILLILKKKYIYNKTMLAVLFIIFIVGITTLFMKANILGFIYRAAKVVLLLIYLSVLYKRRDEVAIAFAYFSVYFWAILLSNTISLFVFPAGIIGAYQYSDHSWQPCWMLGNPNSWAFYFIISSFVVVYSSVLKHKYVKFHCYLFILIELFSALYISISSSAIIIPIIILSGMLISKLYSTRKFILLYKIFVLMCLLLSGWIILGGWESQYIRNAIKALTGESMSFIARGNIWNSAIKQISNTPLVGVGYGDVEIVIRTNAQRFSAHSSYIQLCLQGGIIPLIILIWLIFKSTLSCKPNNLGSFVICMTTFAYAMLFIVEQNPLHPGIYFIILVNSYSSVLSDKIEHTMRFGSSLSKRRYIDNY